jgi:hypothetical protein
MIATPLRVADRAVPSCGDDLATLPLRQQGVEEWEVQNNPPQRGALQGTGSLIFFFWCTLAREAKAGHGQGQSERKQNVLGLQTLTGKK